MSVCLDPTSHISTKYGTQSDFQVYAAHANGLTGESAGVSEGTNLGVGESHQPYEQSVQHVLIIQNAVLTLTNDTLQKLHKIGLQHGQ